MSSQPLNEQTPLAEALNDRLQRASSLRFGNEGLDLSGALASLDPNMIRAAQDAIHELSKGLPELVVKDERFPNGDVLLVRGVGGIATGFYPNFVGWSLVRCLVQMGSVEAAIAWLLRVLSTKAATGKFINTLWGVKVDREVSLTDGVKLIPIEALPESVQKRRLLGDYGYLFRSFSTMLDWTPPQSALVANVRIEPFLSKEGQTSSEAFDDFMKTKSLLEDITLVLSVIGPSTPMLAMQWVTLDDPTLELASIMSGASMRMGKALEIMPWKPVDAPTMDSHEAQESVHAFLEMHPGTKRKMRVALSRLIQAQLRHDVGDRAVELSTAFETLLGDGGTNEMTHKVSVRLVRLIGGSDDLRKKNYEVMKTTYGYRSGLLHTGFIDPGRQKTINGTKMNAADIVGYAITLGVELLKLLLRRGAIPEWTHFDITDSIKS